MALPEWLILSKAETYISLKDVCEVLNKSETWVRNQIRKGIIPKPTCRKEIVLRERQCLKYSTKPKKTMWNVGEIRPILKNLIEDK